MPRECVNVRVVRQFAIRDPIAQETCKHLILKPRACSRSYLPLRCKVHHLCAASRYQATRWTLRVRARRHVGSLGDALARYLLGPRSSA